LTDNSRRVDAYRFHDAIHMGFLAVLNWSPTLRALLRLKRKSNPETDECEDGARAIFAEEGLAAVLSRLAKRRTGFLIEASVDGEVIDVAKAAAVDLEVEPLPAWLWRRAICQGFQAMHQLSDNGGGYLIADLDQRILTYAKVLS
jgi:MazG C-terminal domain